MAEDKQAGEVPRVSTKLPANQPFNLKGAVGGKKKKSRWNGYDVTPKKREKDE